MITRQTGVEVGQDEGSMQAVVGSREGRREEVLLLLAGSGGLDMKQRMFMQ
jgi:hypothetical protein